MYYVLIAGGLSGINRLGEPPDLGQPWFSGEPKEGLKNEPLEFRIDPESSGNEMRPFYLGAYPLFREDFLKDLTDAEITNLQVFDVELSNPIDNKSYSNYKAVNILNNISCADMKESKFTAVGPNTTTDLVFDTLIDAADIPGVDFVATEPWSG